MGADVKSSRQGIDENLHAVLRAYRAGDGRDHGKQDRGMGERPPPHVASEKRKRAITVATSLFHFGRNSPVGCALSSRLRTRYKIYGTREPPPRFHRNPLSRLDWKN